jgi:hypothetical protein
MTILLQEFPMRCSLMSRRGVAAALGALLLAAPQALEAQQRDKAFTWSGPLPSQGVLFIKNINGGVDVERSSGTRVEVTGEKRWRRGDPDDVRIEQKKSGDNVVICALFNAESTCDEGGIRSGRSMRWNNDNDVSVHFVVRVPDGAKVDLTTVNGGIEVREVTADVRASTVNGAITARGVKGPVRAKTVNGSISVDMTAVGSGADLEYQTVNGTITVEMPANAGVDLELSTVTGRISTDFPITVSGTLSPRRLRGTVGDGGTRLRASTVNGSVTLRRRN